MWRSVAPWVDRPAACPIRSPCWWTTCAGIRLNRHAALAVHFARGEPQFIAIRPGQSFRTYDECPGLGQIVIPALCRKRGVWVYAACWSHARRQFFEVVWLSPRDDSPRLGRSLDLTSLDSTPGQELEVELHGQLDQS